MNGATQPDREFDDLVQEVLDGATDAATREALFARIEVDPVARERVRRMRGVFDQLDQLRSLPMPARAARPSDRVPVASPAPMFRARRSRRAHPVRARWALLAVAAAACATFVLIGPTRELLLESWRGAAGTIGLPSIPLGTQWQAQDARVRIGAARDGDRVRARVHIEAEIPGTVAIAFDPSLWRVREVEISGSGAGWVAPEPGSIQVSVVREVEVLLAFEPIDGSATRDVITLHLRAGDDLTTQVVPIGAHDRAPTNFPDAGR